MKYIKIIILIATLNFSNGILLAKDPVSCRDREEFKVLIDYTKTTFNNPKNKRKEVIKRGPMVVVWSNVTGKLHEVFFHFKNKKFMPDKVLVSYYLQKNKKLVEKKEYKLSLVSQGLMKVKNFKFSDGVRDKKDRPADQYYNFMSGEKVICQLKVSHHHAVEYETIL